MLIRVISLSIPRRVLEAGLTLVKAYFPLAQIEIHMVVAEKETSRRVYSLQIELNGAYLACINDGADESCLLPGGSLSAVWTEDSEKAIEVKLFRDDIAKLKKLLEADGGISLKIFVKQIILKCLTEVTGRALPWGILTGIRPTKLLQRLEDRQISRESQTEILKWRYRLAPQKIELLQRIVAVQKTYLHAIEQNPQYVAVYISIPFCPSRCTYCSFPGYFLGKERSGLREYLGNLERELTAVSELIQERGLFADSVYFGGGTPTVLNSDELGRLLDLIRGRMPLTEDCELTVEGGRPDTLNKEKFAVMAGAGVSRISINPQTMNPSTLKRIGRNHTSEELIEKYQQARVAANWLINMDIILGLPGEGVLDVQDTLEQLVRLKPDNLTVHALAIKRGSKEQEANYIHGAAEVAEQMQDRAAQYALKLGMRPYYLYRQKYSAGNLENIGYATPGKECRYNIAIMEERRSVIGIGAGASTKIVVPGKYSLTNRTHPTDWRVYIAKWRENHQWRRDLLCQG